MSNQDKPATDIYGNPVVETDIHGNPKDKDVYGDRPKDVEGNKPKDIYGNETNS